MRGVVVIGNDVKVYILRFHILPMQFRHSVPGLCEKRGLGGKMPTFSSYKIGKNPSKMAFECQDEMACRSRISHLR